MRLIGYFVVRGQHKGGVVNAVFTFPPLLLIGKISCGFYLYHITVLYTTGPWLERLHRHLPFYEAGWYGWRVLLAENLLLIFALA